VTFFFKYIFLLLLQYTHITLRRLGTISKLVLLQNRPNQREELQVFRDLDSGPKVPRGEPWCLIDSHWITKWKRYVRRETDKMPGPITNAVLLNEDGKPRGGLRYYEDYICVRIFFLSLLRMSFIL